MSECQHLISQRRRSLRMQRNAKPTEKFHPPSVYSRANLGRTEEGDEGGGGREQKRPERVVDVVVVLFDHSLELSFFCVCL